MVFNSIEFLLFAGLFFLLWPVFRVKETTRWTFIVVASFVFYGAWDWRFLFLIVFSGVVDYCAGLALGSATKHRRAILGASLFANLGALFVFKYSVFFATVIQDLVNPLGLEIDLVNSIPEFALILPVGISFYTFQSLSYTIDVYKGKLKPTKNILLFFSYLAMFPQLVAGPIIRAKDFLNQLRSYRIPTEIEKWNAFKMICFGLFQKIVLADNLSFFVDSAYQGKSMYSGSLYWWFIVVAFSFQIYCDFSGYTLIARGIAKYMGYHFKMNFNHPYFAKSIREFWTRWHISLSNWFRDYVYIPLGGSRKGKLYGMFALTLTMLLSGIWHGANYTFIAWASLHVIYLLIERQTNWYKRFKRIPYLLTILIFIQVTLAWIFFRAVSIDQAFNIVGRLVSFKPSNLDFFNTYLTGIVFLILAIIIEMATYSRKNFSPIKRFYRSNKNTFEYTLLTLCILCIVFFRGEGTQFIYFQF